MDDQYYNFAIINDEVVVFWTTWKDGEPTDHRVDLNPMDSKLVIGLVNRQNGVLQEQLQFLVSSKNPPGDVV